MKNPPEAGRIQERRYKIQKRYNNQFRSRSVPLGIVSWDLSVSLFLVSCFFRTVRFYLLAEVAVRSDGHKMRDISFQQFVDRPDVSCDVDTSVSLIFSLKRMVVKRRSERIARKQAKAFPKPSLLCPGESPDRLLKITMRNDTHQIPR